MASQAALARARRKREVSAGLVVLLLVVLAGWAVVHDFNGGFSRATVVRADLSKVGDSLESGNIVTYRDVIIGEVDSFRPRGDGGARLTLRLTDQSAPVPSNVTAVAVPVDLFGATEIMLIPPAEPNGRLRAGQVIPADDRPGVVGLQTALADAYDLLTAVRPAQLSAALTSLGRALEGRGDDLHRLVREASSTLRDLAPTVPHLSDMIVQLARVSDQLADQAPSLLRTLGNLLTPARAVIRAEQTITALLGIAPQVSDQATTVLEASAEDVITVVTGQQPFLAALTEDPHLGATLTTGLRRAVDAINSAAPEGRLHADAHISGINLAGIVQTFLGKPSAVVLTSADPPLYGSSTSRRRQVGTVTTAGDAGTSHSAVGGSEERALVTRLTSQITGLAPGEVSTAADVLLGPLLRGRLVVVP